MYVVHAHLQWYIDESMTVSAMNHAVAMKAGWSVLSVASAYAVAVGGFCL